MKRISAMLISLMLVLLLAMPAFSAEKVTDTSSTEVTTEKKTIKPAKVENLICKSSTTDSAIISWSKSKNASAYRIYKYDAVHSKYNYVASTKELTYNLTELSAGKTYSFKVRAILRKGENITKGEYSLACLVVTSPTVVGQIKTGNITKTSILLYWDKVKGATGYKAYYYNRKSGKYIPAGYSKANEITVSGLKENTYYSFLVRAYRKDENIVAFGDASNLYMECTNKKGIPETVAQAVRDYNFAVNTAKATKNMTVKFKKTIETGELSCSVKAIESTVKNTLNLFDGTLSKTYKFSNGKSGDVTSNSLFEPYNESARLLKDYVSSYTVTKTKSGFKLYFKLKYDNVTYDGKETLDSKYITSVITPPRLENIKTTPLKVKKADIYYDGPEISATILNGKLQSMEISCGSLINADFKVSTLKCNTIVSYEERETYKITY